MKLIINEWSFLIINGLISEAKYQDVIKKLKKGDEVQYSDKNGDLLNFEVIFNDNGQLYLKNLDGGVYKNNYFFITVSDLTTNNLSFKTINVKKNLPDNLQNESDDIKLSEILKLFPTSKWRKSSFKAIDRLLMGNEVIEMDKPDNEDEKFKNYIKVTDLNDLYEEFKSFKEGTTYRFTLSNGGTIDLNLIDNKEGSLLFEYNSLGGAAKSYNQLINAELILDLNKPNIEQRVSSLVSDENVDSVYTIKFNKLKEGVDKNGNRAYDVVTIKNIKEIDPIGKFNDEDKGDEEIPNIEELSDKEIDDMSSEDITKLVLSDPTFKAAFLSKPGFWKRLVGGKPKGILPAKEILKNFNSPSSSSKEGKKNSVFTFFDFEKGTKKNYYIQLTDKSFDRDGVVLDITKKYAVVAQKQTLNEKTNVWLYGENFVFKVNKLYSSEINNEFRATLIINSNKDNEYRENRTIRVLN
jgi:hypothetical protein